jgi:protein TonB
MITKHPTADLRAGYQKTFEAAMAIALAMIIAAFRFFPATPSAAATPGPLIEQPIDALPEPTVQRITPPPPLVPRIGTDPISDVLPDSIEFQSDLIPDAPRPPNPPEDLHEFIAIYETPEPIGGYSALKANLEYPAMARRVGREGTVVVVAFIDESGIVRKAEVAKGIGLGCDEAAVAAVLKTRFHPATQRGKSVKVRVSIPIRFRLAR